MTCAGATRRNLSTSLRRKPQADPMREFDTLPPVLRRWLSEARLPWSPRSVRKVWERALARHAGDPAAALASLDRAERKTLKRDVPKVWGRAYPEIGLEPPSC
jgi:hypothetical protein